MSSLGEVRKRVVGEILEVDDLGGCTVEFGKVPPRRWVSVPQAVLSDAGVQPSMDRYFTVVINTGAIDPGCFEPDGFEPWQHKPPTDDLVWEAK